MKAAMRWLDFCLLIVGVFALWWLLARLAGSDAISSPSQTMARAGAYLVSASFWRNARATGIAFGWACLISTVGGLAIGMTVGMNKLATEVAEPLLGVIYSLPKITLYPIVLLVFGLTLSAKVAFGVLQGIFPVALLTIGALRNTKQVYIKTARVMRLSGRQTAIDVLLPAILPEVVTGLRIGVSSALLGTLIAEFFASDKGVGFMLIRALDANQIVDVMALAFLLFVFGSIIAWILLAIERRVHRI